MEKKRKKVTEMCVFRTLSDGARLLDVTWKGGR